MSPEMEHGASTDTELSSSPGNREATTQPKMDTSRVYEAVATSNIEFFKASQLDIDNFVSPAQNTILHLYIISQSKVEKKKTTLEKLRQPLKYVDALFEEETSSQPSPVETVQKMLEEWPSLLWKANDKKDTPLHMAARHGHKAIARALIGYAKQNRDDVAGAKEDVETGQSAVLKMLHQTNAAGETALHLAVRYEHNAVVRMLIKEDDGEFLYSPNKDDETPLYMAAERGMKGVIKLILNKYTPPAYKGPDDRTALHAVALYNRCVRTKLCFIPKSCTQEQEVDISEYVKAMIRKNGYEDLTTKIDKDGRTPLHYNPELLLKSGDKSAILMADNDGNTALHIAASKGDSQGVKQFIENCPECFDLVDKEGRNALHLAVQSGNRTIVDLILENEHLGDLLKQKDNNGNTPLHLHATSPNLWHDVLTDKRFDKRAFNNNKLNPYDALLSNKPNTKRQKNFLAKAKFYPGGRILRNSNTMKGKENGDNGSDEHNLKDEKHSKLVVENGDNGQVKGSDDDNLKDEKHGKLVVTASDEDNLQDERQSQLVVAALIATVTFAAGFTLPGGYIQDKGEDEGYAVLTKSAAFVAFVISDSFGLVFSCAAVFMHLIIAMDDYKDKTIVRKLFEKALPLTLFAIVAMVISFLTGTYAVLANSMSLAISVSVIGVVFFCLLGYLVEEARDTSSPIFGSLIDRLAIWVIDGLTSLVGWLVIAVGFATLLLQYLLLGVACIIATLCYAAYSLIRYTWSRARSIITKLHDA